MVIHLAGVDPQWLRPGCTTGYITGIREAAYEDLLVSFFKYVGTEEVLPSQPIKGTEVEEDT